MRSEWYRDKRDLVKWTSLLYLAKREKANFILHVAMCPLPETKTHKLRTNSGDVANAGQSFNQVIGHFRVDDWTKDLKSLCSSQGIDVETIEDHYSKQNSTSYFNEVRKKIEKIKKKYKKSPVLVFLDPDTGIAPPTAVTRKHVTRSHLQLVFNELRSGDYLVCYQHRKRQKDWSNWARKEIAIAVDLKVNLVEFFLSDYDSDLTILAVKKPHKKEGVCTC